MARSIAICNQKGGVGKTTTAMNLAAYLAILGNRTLLIDFDPQANATSGLGVRYGENETIYHAILGGVTPDHVIKRTYLSNLDVAPASQDLAGALVELVNLQGREYFLRNFVAHVAPYYQFILIDLAPSLNLLTLNGLLAADEVIIPVQCEYFSLEGLSQLLETMELIRTNMNHPIEIGGALLTMYDKRERLSREVAREVRRRFPNQVYDIEIPKSISLAEAPSFQKPVVLHAPQSAGALAYEQLAKEVMNQFPDKSAPSYIPPIIPMHEDQKQQDFSSEDVSHDEYTESAEQEPYILEEQKHNEQTEELETNSIYRESNDENEIEIQVFEEHVRDTPKTDEEFYKKYFPFYE